MNGLSLGEDTQFTSLGLLSVWSFDGPISVVTWWPFPSGVDSSSLEVCAPPTFPPQCVDPSGVQCHSEI